MHVATRPPTHPPSRTEMEPQTHHHHHCKPKLASFVSSSKSNLSQRHIQVFQDAAPLGDTDATCPSPEISTCSSVANQCPASSGTNRPIFITQHHCSSRTAADPKYAHDKSGVGPQQSETVAIVNRFLICDAAGGGLSPASEKALRHPRPQSAHFPFPKIQSTHRPRFKAP